METTQKYWVNNLDPFIIRFPESWPIEGIRWYGFAYLLGFIIAAYLLHLYYKKGKSPINSDRQSILMTFVMIGVLAGGRLGYMLLYDFSEFIKNPMIIFRFWDGGMASHGGFVGVILALIFFAKTQKLPLLKVTDICSTIAAPGFCLGRIANFINGYLWGTPSNLPWAIIFPHSRPEMSPDYIQPRHPSQIYEALLEGVVLFAYMQIRFWKKKPLPNGQLGGEFLIVYSILRIFGELFREPDAALILGVNRGIFYSVLLGIFGVGVIVYSRIFQTTNETS